MLPPDVQGKIMLSFVEERQRAYLQATEQVAGKQPSLRARFLRVSGLALIAAGSRLQALAGAPLSDHPVGEMAG